MARARGLRSLVVVLVAVLSLGGGDLAAAGVAASVASHPASSIVDEAPAAVTADAAQRQRSVVRRRTGRLATGRGIAARIRRGGLRRWLPLRSALLTAPMWRGPPALLP